MMKCFVENASASAAIASTKNVSMKNVVEFGDFLLLLC